MKAIYRVTIHGRILESGDLQKLLARAVQEKRNMDRILHSQSRFRIRNSTATVTAQQLSHRVM
jgi:hypothetical protein